ncbi:hypothetical protein ACJJTC_004611 [Scirpophaga incertulas]
MSLLQELSFQLYQTALAFTREKCEVIADIANIKLSFTDKKKPGEYLIKTLDRQGFTVDQYKHLVAQASQVKTILTYYKPKAKIAILIANDRYTYLPKLATPSVDCNMLATNLKTLGFIVITLKNTVSINFQTLLIKIIQEIPENAYFFIFYAGHGIEICNTKCMLFINCPEENIDKTHCVTENYILKEIAKCKPELCMLIMDMCRVPLDRIVNPSIYLSMLDVEEYSVHSNLLVAYSTQSSESAYEMLELELDTSISLDENVTYQLKTGDTDKILPGSSFYVNALCKRLTDNLDVWRLIDKVHGDMENCIRKQKPIKVQCGVAKRSLYDPVEGDVENLISKVKEVTKDIDKCLVLT